MRNMIIASTMKMDHYSVCSFRDTLVCPLARMNEAIYLCLGRVYTFAPKRTGSRAALRTVQVLSGPTKERITYMYLVSDITT